ncbi:MAG: peptide deformylase [Acidobacteria bacterium]|nr:peptide deformylase [Acidobacteriota bacterium]
MSILKVARMGHPVLRRRARALDPDEIRKPAVQQLIDELMQTMAEYQGIGLAAPQVHESVRVFVAGYEDESAGDREHAPLKVMALINPEVEPVGNEQVEDWEGCLSIPEIRGRVRRARDVRVRGYDRDGLKIELKAHGYFARVLQHETDHLDGILFVDRMETFESLTFLDEYSRYWAKAES